jgi:hypothetical protein
VHFLRRNQGSAESHRGNRGCRTFTRCRQCTRATQRMRTGTRQNPAARKGRMNGHTGEAGVPFGALALFVNIFSAINTTSTHNVANTLLKSLPFSYLNKLPTVPSACAMCCAEADLSPTRSSTLTATTLLGLSSIAPQTSLNLFYKFHFATRRF